MPALMYVAVMAIIQRDGRVLIARRHPDHYHGGGGKWEMPSGRLEAGESLEEGLIREVYEETGLSVRVLAPIATWCLPERSLVGVTFVCDYLSGEVQLTSEHTEYAWIDINDFENYSRKPFILDSVERYRGWRRRWFA